MTADLEVVRAGHPLLDGEAGAPALLHGDAVLTYAELSAEVDRVAALLGTERRLVALEAGNDVATVVTYLAALAGRHPVLLLAPGDVERRGDVLDRFSPDVVQVAGSEEPRAVRRGTRHELHPDLAVLLSTSGSTGSPKLVRLSRSNVVENARSIASYLTIRDTDRAPTTLPMHYCYGLSVLNSHLLAGASIVLTDLSVSDECFWDLMDTTRATSMAGVPYTFDLLDASGFADRDLPALRYVTQAGGRMAPGRVAAYAELGRRHGWDLFVMYGQTEATARMAYLSPDLVAAHPSAIGVPVPGGALRVEPVDGVDEPGAGELVYTGPNVMMGYANDERDLAREPELAELRTGDLGRQGPGGLWEITGRLDRNAKVFGLRLDLDRVEARLAAHDAGARVVAHGERLWVFVARDRTAGRGAALAAETTGLPASAVHATKLSAFPTTPNGKTDYAALERHAALLDADLAGPDDPADDRSRVTPEAIRDVYAHLLGRPRATTRDSFVSLGGDSLSYVEVSVRLGRLLGDLPAGWPRLEPVELAASAPAVRRRGLPLDGSVLLRALAIMAIVMTHADLVQWQGGAHVLLAVAGYNLARFRLDIAGRGARARALLLTAVGVAVPAALWITAVALEDGAYEPATALFLNGLLGSDTWSEDWQFWFLETLIWTYAGLAALLAVPLLDRWQRRHAFGTALTLLAVALLIRYLWVGIEAGLTERYTTGVVLWCIALGWAAATTRTRSERLLVGVIAVVATVGFFGDTRRELIVIAGVLWLLADVTIALPRPLTYVVRLVAGASLWIYLTHWEVYPNLEEAGHPVLAVVASLVVGIACHGVHQAAWPRLRRCPRHRVRRVNDRAECVGPAAFRFPRSLNQRSSAAKPPDTVSSHHPR